MYGTVDGNLAHAAVVALLNDASRDLFCTGTLIARDVVLAAAHCVEATSVSRLKIFFGADINKSGTTLAVTEILAHPEYGGWSLLHHDLGLIRLASPAPAEITPIPHLPAALGISAADEGAVVEFSGYGLTESDVFGVKLRTELPIDTVCPGPNSCDAWVSAQAFGYRQSSTGPCAGDSGGPAFLLRAGKEYVAGVTSYGDGACVSIGVSTTVSEFAAWIDDFIGVQSVEDCDNGIDDDQDNQIDCQDSDCGADPACQTPAENCSNGLDDDQDGQIDCADSDCASSPSCQAVTENCGNGVDDDQDGLADCADTDCAADPVCQGTAEICADGLDNDNDALIDCADDDCATFAACISPGNSGGCQHAPLSAPAGWGFSLLLIGMLLVGKKRKPR